MAASLDELIRETEDIASDFTEYFRTVRRFDRFGFDP